MVVLGVMDKDSIVEVWVQRDGVHSVLALSVLISDGVTHPVVYCGQVAPPLGGIQPLLLDAGVE